MSNIIGATVGTTINPETIKDKLKPVLSVNGVKPDNTGDVKFEDDKSLFIAIQNQSTWEEVKSAIEAGKFVIAKANTTYYILTNYDSSLIRFSRAYQSGTYHITLNTSNKWASGSTTHAKSNHTHDSSDITFTDNDKAELAEYVRSTLPIYNGEVVTE